MKVRISFTVDIDPQAWADEYGTERDGAPTHGDVQRHVESMVTAQLDSLGLLA